VIIDAELGHLQMLQKLELGADAVLVNTAIAVAGNRN
jgi:thiazole synthase ThiGH ThiG subunit